MNLRALVNGLDDKTVMDLALHLRAVNVQEVKWRISLCLPSNIQQGLIAIGVEKGILKMLAGGGVSD